MRVVVTRPAAQAGELIRKLTDRGATVVSLPLIATQPVTLNDEIHDALTHLGRYDVVIVTSANGADCFAARLADIAQSVSGSVRVVAVGPSTAAALRALGLPVHLVPPVATGAAIVTALGESIRGARVLLTRAREGRPELPEGLRAAGACVDDVAFYDTIAVEPDRAAVEAAFPADAIVLTAPSSVRGALRSIGWERLSSTAIITIGPTTSAAVHEAKLTVAAEAEHQTTDALVAAVFAPPDEPS